MSPEVHQAILRMAVDAPEAFLAGKLDARANGMKGKPGLAVLGPHRQSLELEEIGKKSCANASRRLIAHVADQMSCAEIDVVDILHLGKVLFAIDIASTLR